MRNNNSEDKYSKHLFAIFLKELPSFYKNSTRTIPFNYCYWWFSTRRIDKKIARDLMRKWCQEKLCELVTYHGIQIIGVEK